MEPPPSEPVAREQRPAMRAAPAPPLEPPLVRSVFQGFRQALAEKVLGGAGLAELGGVGLAEDDGAGLPDSLYGDGIFVGDVVSEDVAAHSAADALGELQVLDGDGDAVEGPEVVAAGHGVLRPLRPSLGRGLR